MKFSIEKGYESFTYRMYRCYNKKSLIIYVKFQFVFLLYGEHAVTLLSNTSGCPNFFFTIPHFKEIEFGKLEI